MVGNESILSISDTATFTIPHTSMMLKLFLIVPSLKKKLLSILQHTTDHNCYLIFLFLELLNQGLVDETSVVEGARA